MIARVFPTRTVATPIDPFVFFDQPPFFLDGITEAHVSVTFTWDIPVAEFLSDKWSRVVPTKMGGPALNTKGHEFEPGFYLKKGYTITSRGCPNRCWFCSVWKRDGDLTEFPIKAGWNVLDDNLLACSESHIRSVFAMLKKQERRAEFTGGLEAKRLKPWHVELLQDLKPAQMFFAYDTEDDKEPLIEASKMLTKVGFNRHNLRCYVLIGYPKDTFEKATERLEFVKNLGICPCAMLYRNEKTGQEPVGWSNFQRDWFRPALIYSNHKNTDENELGLLVKEEIRK